MNNAFIQFLISLVKANPQLLVTVLQMLVDYLKNNPTVQQTIIDELVARYGPK